MKTEDYDALIEKRIARPGEVEEIKQALRLSDAARNLESLTRLAEAKSREPVAAPADPSPADPSVVTE